MEISPNIINYKIFISQTQKYLDKLYKLCVTDIMSNNRQNVQEVDKTSNTLTNCHYKPHQFKPLEIRNPGGRPPKITPQMVYEQIKNLDNIQILKDNVKWSLSLLISTIKNKDSGLKMRVDVAKWLYDKCQEMDRPNIQVNDINVLVLAYEDQYKELIAKHSKAIDKTKVIDVKVEGENG